MKVSSSDKPGVFLLISALVVILGGCGAAASPEAAQSSRDAPVASLPPSDAPPWPEQCNPILEEKSVVLEGWPWDSVEDWARQDVAVLHAHVTAEGPGQVAEGTDIETPRLVEVQVEAAILGRGVIKDGETIVVGGDFYKNPPQDNEGRADCRILMPGDEVVIGIYINESSGPAYLLNRDSIFYVVGGDRIADTGRQYGGIELLESLSLSGLTSTVRSLPVTPPPPPESEPAIPSWAPSEKPLT